MEGEYLFRPGNIGKMEIKNRLVMAPMGMTGLVDLDGRYSQRGVDYFVARAKGGVGMIVTGLIPVEMEVERRSTDQLTMYPRVDSPLFIARLNELTDAVHDYGAKIAAQLTAGMGRVARAAVAQSGWAVSSSSGPCFWDPSCNAKELTLEAIERLINAFGVAATTVHAAGFDAIEIHAHEGYLIDQFMTGLWNRRTDKFGGDLDGRLTFALEIIQSIRKAVGPDFPIIFRMASRHHLEGARDIEESIMIAKRMEERGVNCLHIDAGCYESWDWAHPPVIREMTVEDAALIKKNVSIPIIVVGRLDNPHVADKILAEEKADFVALGRALLADPEWPYKVKAKRFKEIRPCIGDHDGCLGRIFKGRYLSCVVNPQTGKEREFSLKPASKKKSILVVGGGPGGMEAARVAALRGHEVTLWDKNGQLGGNLIPASVPSFNSDLRNLISYLSNQIEMLGVKIHLKKEAIPDLLINHNPDEVIIATGAVPVVPEIPGNDKEQVVMASDLLTGKRESGNDVIVFGGGYMGCQTAIWLAESSKKVTIIEALDDLMAGMFPANRQYLLSLIDDFGITVMTGTKLLEITGNGVIIEKSGKKKALETETVTFAVGLKPLTNLYESLKNTHFRVHAIGDCVLPRKVQGAIWDAFRLTRMM